RWRNVRYGDLSAADDAVDGKRRGATGWRRARGGDEQGASHLSQIWIAHQVRACWRVLNVGWLRVEAGHQEVAIDVAPGDFHFFTAGKVIRTSREPAASNRSM